MADDHQAMPTEASPEQDVQQAKTTKTGLQPLAVAGAELRQGRGSLPDSATGPSPGTPTVPWEAGLSQRTTTTESGLPSITESRQGPQEPRPGRPPLPDIQTAVDRFDNNEEESPVDGPSLTLSRRGVASSVATIAPISGPTPGLDGTEEPSPLSSPVRSASAKGKQKENWPLSTKSTTTASKLAPETNVVSSSSLLDDIDAITRAPTPEAEPEVKDEPLLQHEKPTVRGGVRFQDDTTSQASGLKAQGKQTSELDDEAVGSTLTPVNSPHDQKSTTWYPPRKEAEVPQRPQGPQWPRPPNPLSTEMRERLKWRRYKRHSDRAADQARKRASPNARTPSKGFGTKIAAVSQEAIGRLGDVLAEVGAQIRSSRRPQNTFSEPGKAPRRSPFSLRSWQRRSRSDQQPNDDLTSMEPLIEQDEPESSEAGSRRGTLRTRFLSFSKAPTSSGPSGGQSSETQPQSASGRSTGVPRDARPSIPSEWLPNAETFNEHAKRTGMTATFVDVQPGPSQAAPGSVGNAENVLTVQEHASSQQELEKFQQQLDARRQWEASRQGQEAASRSDRLRLPGTIVRSNSDWRRKTLISVREAGRRCAQTHERSHRRHSESDLLTSTFHSGFPRDFRGDVSSLLGRDGGGGRLGMITPDQQIDVTDAQIRATARSRELAAIVASARVRSAGFVPSRLQPPMEDLGEEAGPVVERAAGTQAGPGIQGDSGTQVVSGTPVSETPAASGAQASATQAASETPAASGAQAALRTSGASGTQAGPIDQE